MVELQEYVKKVDLTPNPSETSRWMGELRSGANMTRFW